MKRIKELRNKITHPDKTTKYAYLIWFPLIAFILGQAAGFGFTHPGTVAIVVNAGLMLCIQIFLTALFGSVLAAANTVLITFVLFGVFDGILIIARGFPVTPVDILSLKTALSVAQNYTFEPSFAGIIALIVLAVMIWANRIYLNISLSDLRIGSKKRRIIAALCSTVVFIGISAYTVSDLTFFETFAYEKASEQRKNGILASLIYEGTGLIYTKPEDYDKNTEAEILASITPEGADIEENEYPDVIVVMDEAFADLGDISETLKNETDIVPFTRSVLAGDLDNTISGKLRVSILGGNTVNSEWEFLTGNSLYNLPEDSIPYEQHISEDTDLSYAVPAQLKVLGYSATSIHPYSEAGYNRNVIYSHFGFDNMIFEESFEGAEKVRDFYSDKAVFDKVLEVADSSASPQFIFAVTMQNHAYYSDEQAIENGCQLSLAGENDAKEFTVKSAKEYVAGATELNTYLALANTTDSALKDFIEEIDKRDKKTIVVFYGDHQPTPSVANETPDAAEDTESYYQVPYFVHANFDIDTKTNATTSANYLGMLTMKAAGLPLNQYFTYLDNLHETYNAVSGIYVEFKNKEVDINDCKKDETLKEYEKLQAYMMFDY